jgi:uncharacterized membrane protein AbrB (regulator of aidB expression)
MNNNSPLFSNMTPADWLLAALFTFIVAFLLQSFFPPFGWLIGILVSLGLLYLAKRRRDKLQHPPDDPSSPQ